MKSSIFYPETNGHPPPTAEVEIHTPEGVIRGLLHKAEGARGAMVMVGDASGGVEGPAGLYEKLAEQLQKSGIMALRIDYREPGDLRESIYDVLAGIEAVRQQGAERVALLGWSFGTDLALMHGLDPSVHGAILLSPPLRYSVDADLDRWASSGKPVVALVPEFDDYLRPDEARRRFARIPQAEVIGIEGAKHLWVGEKYVQRVLDEVVARVVPTVATPLPRAWEGEAWFWDDLQGGLREL